MSLCTNVVPSLSTSIDINPLYTELQDVMLRLGKPDTDPTPVLHHVMSQMQMYVLRAHLHTWQANHQTIVGDVNDLADEVYTRNQGSSSYERKSLMFRGNAVDWLDSCVVGGARKDVKVVVHRGDTSIRIYVADRWVTILNDFMVYEFGYDRALAQYSEANTPTKGELQRYLRLILPSVIRKARNMRCCKDCFSTVDREDTPHYYDKAIAECCSECSINRAAKRLCHRL